MAEPAGTAAAPAPVAPVAATASGVVLADARGGGRAMRVTWHHEVDLVVLSVWKDETCVATVRVTRDDVPALVNALVSGLAERPAPEPDLPPDMPPG
ncbi:MAG TPA: hypothetical protein VFV76_00785 [Actinomycetes bacterium]|nr:hypothetical protein [Actinomycetes bacterium]